MVLHYGEREARYHTPCRRLCHAADRQARRTLVQKAMNDYRTWRDSRAARMAALAVAAVMMNAGTLHAQCPTPGASETLAHPFRVQWNVGNLLVTPDSIHGVSLWFVTNQSARSDGHQVDRQFDDRFVPDSLYYWIMLTRQLLELRAPLPNDTSTIVSSGYLRGVDGGVIVVARIRKGKKLSDKARVLMMPRLDTAVMIELDRSSVDTLLDASEVAARWSAYRHVPGVDDTVPDMRRNPVSALPSTRKPRYPLSLQQQSIEGEVWARFCVDVDGRPDLSTFWAQLSDDREFEQAVKEYLREVRYKPATFNGTPIRQMASQRFVFALRR